MYEAVRTAINWTLLIKGAITAFLAVALVLPLVAIGGLVGARQESSRAVLEDIQQAGVGTQTLTGPILVLPFRRTIETETTDVATGKKSTLTRYEEDRQYFLPEALDATVRVGTELRYRGIYSARLFDADHEIRGSFTLPDGFGIPPLAHVTYEFREAFLILAISDTRGIRGAPGVSWDGAAREWTGGTEGAALETGMSTAIGRVEPGRTYS
jgi:inner membrane protein